MRTYKEVKKEVTSKVQETWTCDWCGKDVDLDDSIANDEQFELSFQTLSGTGIYLASSGWQVEDLCKSCIERLRKLLEKEGVKISEASW